MKVILLEDVKKQGKKDQVIDVSDGYATNFLINKGLAVPYNKSNKSRLESTLKTRKENEEKLIEEANKEKKVLENIQLEFKVKTGNNGKIFGTISSKQISDELKNKGYNIDKKDILLDHQIDSLGVHFVDVRLHKSVVAKVSVIVEQLKR